jgi:hypothetical protein
MILQEMKSGTEMKDRNPFNEAKMPRNSIMNDKGDERGQDD